MGRLTEEERALVERCYLATGSIRAQYQRRFPGPDYDGFSAERLCSQAHRFDPALSSEWTWSWRHVKGACFDALNRFDMVTQRHRLPWRLKWTSGLPLVFSLETIPEWQVIGDASDVPIILKRDTEDYLLRGLDPRSATIIKESVFYGEKQYEVARNLGITDARASQLKIEGLDLLRQRIEMTGGVL